jgi:hypothetical protein
MMIEKIFRNLIAVILTSVLVTGAAAQSAAPNQSIEGVWEGTLDFGSEKFRISLKIARDADGSLNAKADSPDTAVSDIPVDSISLKDGVVRFEIKQVIPVMASFEGKLNKEASEIAGEFKQGGTSVPLTLKRAAKPAAPNRP